MKQVADTISGYSYGEPDVVQSAVSVRDLDGLVLVVEPAQKPG